MIENVTLFNNHAKMPSMQGFGQRLKAWRESRGISGWRIEKETGLSRQNLSNIENGHRPASEDALRRIASIPDMGISYEALNAWQLLDGLTREEALAIKRELEKDPEVKKGAET